MALGQMASETRDGLQKRLARKLKRKMQLAIEIEWPWRRGWQLNQGTALVHQEIFKGIESNSSIGGNVSTVCSNEEVKRDFISFR